MAANIVQGISQQDVSGISLPASVGTTQDKLKSPQSALLADTRLEEPLLEVLNLIRLELTAIRLGMQERLNAGNGPYEQFDLLEMAQSIRDDDTEEP